MKFTTQVHITLQEAPPSAAARRTALVVNSAGILLAVWTLLLPLPYRLVILLCTVWPAAVLWVIVNARGDIVLESKPRAKTPSLISGLLFPLPALALRALLDVQIEDYQRFWLPFALVALLAMAGLMRFGLERGRAWRWGTLLYLPVLALYGYGVTVMADVLLDNSPPNRYRATVLAKYVKKDRRSGSTYYLSLSGWGGQAGQVEATVSHRMYDRVQTKEKVLVLEKPGALDVPWFIVRPLPDGSKKPPG